MNTHSIRPGSPSTAVLWLALSLVPASGLADVITVDDDDPAADFATIQEGVDAAVDGDRIEVGPGYYYSGAKAAVPVVKVIGKSIDIVATSANPEDTVIAGQGYRRCVEWENPGGIGSLVGFTMDSGFTSGDGGGLRLDGAAIEIENCVFNNCVAASDGGAVSSWCDMVIPPVARECRFVFNSAGSEGGGLHAIGGFDLFECTFEDNDAIARGGGVMWNGDPAGSFNFSLVQGCVWRQCTSQIGGGAYGVDARLRLADCDFFDCEAGDDVAKTGWGGGLAVALGELEMTGGRFSGCEGGESSGGLDLDQSSGTCSNVDFSGNIGWRIAGGVYCFGGASSLSLDGCTFRDNLAAFGGGGAIACHSSTSALTVVDCSFDDNGAFGPGYCISAPNIVTASGCEFNAQQVDDAPVQHVALHGIGTGSRFESCRFVDAVSRDLASSIRATSIGGLEFVDCTFENNSTVGDGDPAIEGAVFIQADPGSDEPIRFEGCDFRSNGGCCIGAGFFAGAGGALRVDGRIAEISFCTFGNNSATDGGSLHGAFQLTNCDLYGLVSIGQGGAAILLSGSSVVDCRISGSADCNYPWIVTTGEVTIDGCTMSGGYPEGFECFPDPDELAGCRLSAGTTVRNTRFCDYDPAAIYGAWEDLGGNSFHPDGCDPADVNGDGIVNGADLASVLALWGEPCLGCAADINGDGIVNGADLALVLAGWSG